MTERCLGTEFVAHSAGQPAFQQVLDRHVLQADISDCRLYLPVSESVYLLSSIRYESNMLDKELALSRCQKECLCKAHQADGSPLYGARPAREKVRNMEILKKECSYQFFQMSQVPSLYASLCLSLSWAVNASLFPSFTGQAPVSSLIGDTTSTTGRTYGKGLATRGTGRLSFNKSHNFDLLSSRNVLKRQNSINKQTRRLQAPTYSFSTPSNILSDWQRSEQHK